MVKLDYNKFIVFMPTTSLRIDSSSIFEHFNSHLQILNNSRIIFSAPFGTGKSVYLEDFFSGHKEKYVTIKLYPVHYSVSSSEDIFELMKFDILVSLLDNFNLSLKKDEFNMVLSSQVYLMQQMRRIGSTSIINTLLTLCDITGNWNNAKTILTPLKNFIADVKTFKKEMETDEAATLATFLDNIEAKAGTAREMDSISHLIRTLLSRVKTADSKTATTTVLIVDDIDRLDPEHVFRLFNVFSAHHNPISDTNKFGFDKVIFVCDINNIRNIFHSKYGQKVDFTGYIDKFYSNEIYSFDNTELVKKHLKTLICSIPYPEKYRSYGEEYMKRRIFSSNNRFYGFFEWIIFSLLDAGLLNLRTLSSLRQLTLPEYQFSLHHIKSPKHASDYLLLIAFHFLKQFWGSTQLVHQKLGELAQLSEKGTHPNYLDNYIDASYLQSNFIEYLLPFMLPPHISFPNTQIDEKSIFTHTLSDGDTIHFRYAKDHSSRHNALELVRITEKGSGEDATINLYEQLYQTYDTCLKRKIVR